MGLLKIGNAQFIEICLQVAVPPPQKKKKNLMGSSSIFSQGALSRNDTSQHTKLDSKEFSTADNMGWITRVDVNFHYDLYS